MKNRLNLKVNNWVVVGVLVVFVVLYSFFVPELVFVERGSDGVGLDEFNYEMDFYGSNLRVFVADEEDEMFRGLSGVEVLPDGYGMLFTFNEWGRHGIWMKDMKIPIDIVWLDDKYEIVDYVKNVSPDTYPEVFYPKKDAFYVLELPAGYLDKLNI